jgi:rhamnose transport system ATP-binding protein
LATAPLLQLDRVSKSYGGVRALERISGTIDVGEVHAICGENGAGKSTLIKILTGVVRPDEGQIQFDGKPLTVGNVSAAERAGIAVMHQESTAFPDLDAVDNIFVGRERGRWWLDRATMERQASDLLQRLGERIDCRQPLSQLPLAQRQMVSMARALMGNCRLLIMDEPTASLSARETQVLFDQIRALRREGISVLYVSHRLEEIFAISDRITVLRDGQWIGTQATSQMTRESLIERMVGRAVEPMNDKRSTPFGPAVPRLRIQNLTRAGSFAAIHLTVHAGEILGLGGLVGAGRSEVVRAVFGVDRYDSGTVFVDGTPIPPGSVAAAMRAGLALVPEDRQHEGLVLPMSIGANVSLAVLSSLQWLGCIQRRREAAIVDQQLTRLQVKSDGVRRPAATLSGGNQQKLVLGKWLASRPRVLILDEPTRGIDVGAKSQFHHLIRQLAEQGLAILLISSDLPELLALSDRVVVMRQGQCVGEYSRAEATPEKVLKLALPDGAGRDGGDRHA